LWPLTLTRPHLRQIEISVTSVSATTRDEGSAQLFGMDIEPVADDALLDKWRRLQADITKDIEVVAQCQAGRPCSATVQRLVSLSLGSYGQSGRARVGLLNRAVDLVITPVSDETQWRLPDHWSDPLETLHIEQSRQGSALVGCLEVIGEVEVIPMPAHAASHAASALPTTSRACTGTATAVWSLKNVQTSGDIKPA
jgi:hypothetical protein